MVEKGEFMLVRQRRRPQPQTGQIDGERVLVDTVKRALGDEAAGMQSLVLAGGNPRLQIGMMAPGLLQPLAELAAGFHQEAPEPQAGSQTSISST